MESKMFRDNSNETTSSSSTNEQTPEVIGKRRSSSQNDISTIKMTNNETLQNFTPPAIHVRPRYSKTQGGESDVYHQGEDRHDRDDAYVIEKGIHDSPEEIDPAGGSEFEASRDTSVVSNGRLRVRLPELVDELEKKYIDDESEEFIENLDRIMGKLYRKYILKNKDDYVDSDDPDVQLYKYSNRYVKDDEDSDDPDVLM